MANFDIDRSRRVAELIKRELAVLISRELNDDRINKLTVTDVDLSKDLKNAAVYVASMDSTVNVQLVERLLMKASRFLRQRLSQQLDLRSTPRLQFKYDKTLDRAMHLENLMSSLNRSTESTFADAEAAKKEQDES